MVSCHDRAQWLYPYLDGELEPLVQAEVEAHLAQCPVCRAEVRQAAAVLARVSTCGRCVCAPDALVERVRRLLHAEPR